MGFASSMLKEWMDGHRFLMSQRVREGHGAGGRGPDYHVRVLYPFLDNGHDRDPEEENACAAA